MASAGVCAGPRGRQPPREGSLAKRDGGAEGWASRAGGEENGVSGQRAEEDEAASRQQTHFITPIWAEPRGTRAHPTSNQPRLTVSLQVSLTGQLSHYIKLLVSGAAQGDVPIRCEPYQLHGRPTSGREGPRGDHISGGSGVRFGGREPSRWCTDRNAIRISRRPSKYQIKVASQPWLGCLHRVGSVTYAFEEGALQRPALCFDRPSSGCRFELL